MEMTTSRKVLNVAAIFEFISGGLCFLLSMVMMTCVFMSAHNAEFAQSLPENADPNTLLYLGIGAFVTALVTIVYGILERRAAKNPSKIMPVLVLSIISAAAEGIIIISNLVQHMAIADMTSDFVSLAASLLIVFVAFNIKKEAGM